MPAMPRAFLRDPGPAFFAAEEAAWAGPRRSTGRG